jgi:hypothetical protein
MVLFRDAVAMVDQSPALSARIQKSGGAGKSGTWLFFRLVHSFAQLVQMTDSRVHDHIALLLMKFTSIKAIRLLK